MSRLPTPWESPRGEAGDGAYLCSLILRFSSWLAQLSGSALFLLIIFLSKESAMTISVPCSGARGIRAGQAGVLILPS